MIILTTIAVTTTMTMTPAAVQQQIMMIMTKDVYDVIIIYDVVLKCQVMYVLFTHSNSQIENKVQ